MHAPFGYGEDEMEGTYSGLALVTVIGKRSIWSSVMVWVTLRPCECRYFQIIFRRITDSGVIIKTFLEIVGGKFDHFRNCWLKTLSCHFLLKFCKISNASFPPKPPKLILKI